MPVTSALETIGQYIAEARRLLQDQITPYRYPDVDLVEAINIGLMEARRVRADLFLPAFVMPWSDTSGTIDTAKAVPLDPMYRSTLVYYIVGRAQLRDDESTTDQRAAALITKFTAQLLTVNS
jgi:hypothetical protein